MMPVEKVYTSPSSPIKAGTMPAPTTNEVGGPNAVLTLLKEGGATRANAPKAAGINADKAADCKNNSTQHKNAA